MWKEQLITLYCTVCRYYSTRVEHFVQRLSNNCCPQFTDEELITVYLWGITQQQLEIKRIHSHTRMHLLEWFPKLPSYQAFNRRLNELSPAFQELAAILLETPAFRTPSFPDGVIDSMPVILARQSRSARAKVSPELCSKSYCASKDQWYYGMKVHALGCLQPNRMPLPRALFVSTATDHDLTVAKQIFACSHPALRRLFADKAYCDIHWRNALAQMGIQLLTPRKKLCGHTDTLPSTDSFSAFVSQVRQPIESFFNWLNVKTGIQVASRVRSTKGLLIHIFGRLAAALCILVLGFNS